MPAKDRKRQRRTPTTASARSTLDALLDAAERVLAREGFEAMTMARIAGEAGMGKATVYHYFASKEALAQRIGLRMWQQLAAAVATRFGEVVGSGFVITIAAVVDAALDHVAEHRALLGHWFKGAPHLGSPPLQGEEAGQLIDLFGAHLAFKGKPFGIENGPLTARVILSTFVGMVLLVARDHPEDFDDPAFRAEVHKVVLRYLAGAAALEHEEAEA